MSSRQQFLLPNVTPGTRVRLDTGSGSTSPADVVDNLNHPVSGAVITADSSGRIASGDIYGPVGVTTLYLKSLDDSDNVTGTTTLTSAHPSAPGGSSSVAWTSVKTANYAASSGEAVPGDASGGAFNVTLPAPAANARVTVKNVGATGTVTVVPHAAETIDGASSYPLATQWLSRDFQSDGANWLVV